MTRLAADSIKIGSEVVDPGRSRTFDLPFARLPTGTWESIPISVINGRKPGPYLWLSGAIHGDEINGVEIIRRVLPRLDARKLAGAVISVPVVNVFGFLNQSRHLPDRRDLNRMFPGSNRGSLASRLAYLFMTEVVSKCEYGIDLHTAAGARTNLPQVRADLNDAETRKLAVAFGTSVAIHAKVRDGSLRQAATELGIKVLLYESGAVLRFEEHCIEAGVHGILRVMQALEMGAWDTPTLAQDPVVIRKTSWVRATRSGIATIEVEPGDAVEAGQRMGAIGDAIGGKPSFIKASASGVVIARTLNPLVSQGDALVHIAVPRVEGRDEPAEPGRRRK